MIFPSPASALQRKGRSAKPLIGIANDIEPIGRRRHYAGTSPVLREPETRFQSGS